MKLEEPYISGFPTSACIRIRERPGKRQIAGWAPPPEFLVHWVWSGTRESAFRTSSRERLMPIVWEAYLRITALHITSVKSDNACKSVPYSGNCYMHVKNLSFNARFPLNSLKRLVSLTKFWKPIHNTLYFFSDAARSLRLKSFLLFLLQQLDFTESIETVQSPAVHSTLPRPQWGFWAISSSTEVNIPY